jgi:putative endonuclease
MLKTGPLFRENMQEDRPRRSKTPGSTRAKGSRAEQVAADFLESQGYAIIERNFLCKAGEIDIIARHQEDLVFVEVKARTTSSGFYPSYSVHTNKQKKIIRTAAVYLSAHCDEPVGARFDVVVVTMGNPPVVDLISDAFRGDSYNLNV